MYIKPIHAIDFYKTGHKIQYPEGTELVYSNFTPRSSRLATKIPRIFDDKVVLFGLQGFIQWFLIVCFRDNFFRQPRNKVVSDYKWHMDNGLGVDSVNCDHIGALHDLGYLPVRIKALPEGSLVNIKVAMFTVVNTHKDFYWLTNYLEDVLSNETWKSCTTATTAWQYRKLLESYAEQTGANKDFVMWQGHDFSFRGTGGMHDGMKNSAGHLLSFFGTDTMLSIDYLLDYYAGHQTFIGGSVPATEHSVMCLNGEHDELGTIRRLINEVYPTGVVSIVSDTWDYWNTISVIANTLKEDILARKENAIGLAKVVFRPDSGDPADIICGNEIPDFSKNCYNIDEVSVHAASFLVTKLCEATTHDKKPVSGITEIFKWRDTHYEIKILTEWYHYDNKHYLEHYEVVSCKQADLTPEQKGSIEVLWDIFGGKINDAGYKELNPRVGLIYGDSITLERADNILQRLKNKGFASSNIVFGIGSFTYQYQTRDSFGFAMKATYGEVNSVGHEMFKDPKTGDGIKKSAKGLLRIEKYGDDFVQYDQQDWEDEAKGELRVVFEDSVAYNFQTLAEIRKTLHG